MADGLLSFGPMNYGLLSPTQLGQLQSSYQPNQGQYNQALPADYKPLNPQPGDEYDPYYNLRMMMPGLLSNPNFSWLKSMNLQPMQGLLIQQPINSANDPGPAQPESPLAGYAGDAKTTALNTAIGIPLATTKGVVNVGKKIIKKIF